MVDVFGHSELQVLDRCRGQLGSDFGNDNLLQVASEVVHPEVVEVSEQINHQDWDTKHQEEKELAPVLDPIDFLDTLES